MKNILDRKNAKVVLELAKRGLNVKQIAKEIGIWYNVANYLVKELKSAGYLTDDKVKLEDVLKSSRRQVIIDMFNENTTITQKAIVNRIKLSRLPADMLEDLRTLENNKIITSETIKNSKVFYLVK